MKKLMEGQEALFTRTEIIKIILAGLLVAAGLYSMAYIVTEFINQVL